MLATEAGLRSSTAQGIYYLIYIEEKKGKKQVESSVKLAVSEPSAKQPQLLEDA